MPAAWQAAQTCRSLSAAQIRDWAGLGVVVPLDMAQACARLGATEAAAEQEWGGGMQLTPFGF